MDIFVGMKTYITRLLEAKLEGLLPHFPAVAILGARQVGKSTLARHFWPKPARMVVFDPVQDVGNARRDPDFFLQNHPPPLFLDEVQYAPEVLAALKRRVDQTGRNGDYLLSGSQNLALVKNLAESMAGRIAILTLWPFARRELVAEVARPSFLKRWLAAPDAVDLPETPLPPSILPYLWRGMHPRLEPDAPELAVSTYWESYLHTYIERDLRSVADIGALQTFSRFMGLLAAQTSCEINGNELGRELGIDRKTAVRWLEIAEATYQWVSVPAFARDPTKQVSGKRKGYFTDTGFACHLQRIQGPEVLGCHPLLGRMFETWVVMEMLKAFQDWAAAPGLFHYRTYNGAEVDVVLEWNGTLFPVEIKTTSKPGPRDGLGIRSFRSAFPKERVAPGLLVCSIEQPAWITPELFAVPWWLL